MKKRICFYTLYTDLGASSNYRAYIYEKGLSEHNFDVTYRNFWSDQYITKYFKNKKKYLVIIIFEYIVASWKRIFQILFLSNKYEYIVFQKEIVPFAPICFIKILLKRNRISIFDLDDAVYLDKRRTKYYEYIGKNCSAIIVGNDYLKSFYEGMNENLIVIPTVDYSPAYMQYIKDTYHNFTIGWIGTKSNITNLDLIVDSYNKLVEEFPKLNFLIICDDDYGYKSKLKNCNFIKWEKETYMEALSNITVGVMPLYDNEFNNGKCGFKLIQYLNLMKPVLASDLEVNRFIIKDYGYVCNQQNWYTKFRDILDEKNYIRMQNNIKESFYNRFGYNNNLHNFILFIESLE